MLALAAGPAAAGLAEPRPRADAEAPADLALLVAGATAALLAGAAAWDLLPGDLVAAGWLVVALAVALAARRLDDFALGHDRRDGGRRSRWRGRSAWCPSCRPRLLTAWSAIPVLAADLPTALDAVYALALPALLLVAPAPRPAALAARRAARAARGRRPVRRRRALCLVQAGVRPRRRGGFRRARPARADHRHPGPVRRRLAARRRHRPAAAGRRRTWRGSPAPCSPPSPRRG